MRRHTWYRQLGDENIAVAVMVFDFRNVIDGSDFVSDDRHIGASGPRCQVVTCKIIAASQFKAGYPRGMFSTSATLGRVEWVVVR